MEIATPKSAAVVTDLGSVTPLPARRVVRAADLTEAEINALRESRMDPRYDYPGAVMEERP